MQFLKTSKQSRVYATSMEFQSTAVTKGALADQRVVRVLLNCGIKDIADSRLTNLKRIRKISDDIYLTLIRSPEIGEIEETLNIANCSFVSEVSTVEKISRVAMRKNLTHDIVVMFDLGDRRERFSTFRNNNCFDLHI